MANPLGKAKKGRNKPDFTNKHKQTIPFIMEKIITEADIILEILDSRFIEKTRNLEIEKSVKELGKKIIYIFNKSDLADIDRIKRNIELSNLKPGLFFSSKERKGSGTLKKLIKIEAHKIGKENVNIGVIGYPNSGKSSLINLLIGRKIAGTSSEAGYTKGVQKAKISKGIYLIDTPGIIPPSEKKSGLGFETKQTSIGSTTWDRTKNPDVVVFNLMKEYPGLLEKYYNIPAQGDVEILIEKLGRKLNYLKKGNEIDEPRTAKKILKDWQEGKIRVR